MNCPECMQRLSEYFDDELAELENQEVQAPLEFCPHCRAVANELQAIHLKIEQAINSIPVPGGLEQRIIAVIEKEHVLERKKVWYTGFILVVLSVPILALFSPLFLSVVRFFYRATSVVLRTWPTLINLVSPVLGIGIILSVLFVLLLGFYVLRSLLKGLRINEVLS